MKLLKRSKKPKISLRDKQLLEEYEKGRILQVDNGIDNKKLMMGVKDE